MTEEPVQPLDVLGSPVRRAILDTLANLPVLATADTPNRSKGLTAAELGERVGLHVTTVRHHLERLELAGLVHRHAERTGVGRPRHHFTAAPGNLAEVGDPSAYRLLAEVLTEAMASVNPDAVSAGRRWSQRTISTALDPDVRAAPARTPGQWLGKLGALIDLLDSWGFDPSVTTEAGGRTSRVCLNRCPLRELAAANPAVACGVHRGVLEGALDALGEEGVTVELEPFVQPDLCVARLTPYPPFPVRTVPSERPLR